MFAFVQFELIGLLISYIDACLWLGNFWSVESLCQLPVMTTKQSSNNLL